MKSKKNRKMKGGTVYLEDIKELIEEADLPKNTEYNNTILHLAVDRGWEDGIEVLLNPKKRSEEVKAALSKSGHTKVDVNARDYGGYTPILDACRVGYMNIVKLLLKNGADLNISGGASGRTPLHDLFYSKIEGSFTITKGKKYFKESAKFLIDQGADVNARDRFGYTPLHLYCSKFHLGVQELVKALLENGADVNARDNYGNTPLHICCFTIYEDIDLDQFLELSPIDFLIKNGANIFAKNNEGFIPSECIKKNPIIKEWMNKKLREQQNAKASTLNSITTDKGENRRLLPPNVLDIISGFIPRDVSRPLTGEELKRSQDGRDKRDILRTMNEKKADGKLLPAEILDNIREYDDPEKAEKIKGNRTKGKKGGKRKTNKKKNSKRKTRKH